MHVSGAQRQVQESCRSLPCQSHNPLGNSGFVGGGAGGGNGEGESAVLTSFPGDFDAGGLWATL